MNNNKQNSFFVEVLKIIRFCRFYSRNGKDFTDEFGDCPESGKFCKYLHRLVSWTLIRNYKLFISNVLLG